MILKTISSRTILTPSKLPGIDFAVNPYIGCPHQCKYCYAVYMKRFTNHTEPWGTFLDVKEFPPIPHPEKYCGKSIVFSSATDAYNPFEAQFRKTRSVLEQLADVGAHISILTKSDLILRDLDLFERMNHGTGSILCAFSINTMDEKFRREMDSAVSIERRLAALETLHDAGIPTAVFISPIFPGITRVTEIIPAARDFCDEFWVENLNLRGEFKPVILRYIRQNYPQFIRLYEDIYVRNDVTFWEELSGKLDEYARNEGVRMLNFFHYN